MIDTKLQKNLIGIAKKYGFDHEFQTDNIKFEIYSFFKEMKFANKDITINVWFHDILSNEFYFFIILNDGDDRNYLNFKDHSGMLDILKTRLLETMWFLKKVSREDRTGANIEPKMFLDNIRKHSSEYNLLKISNTFRGNFVASSIFDRLDYHRENHSLSKVLIDAYLDMKILHKLVEFIQYFIQDIDRQIKKS